MSDTNRRVFTRAESARMRVDNAYRRRRGSDCADARRGRNQRAGEKRQRIKEPLIGSAWFSLAAIFRRFQGPRTDAMQRIVAAAGTLKAAKSVRG